MYTAVDRPFFRLSLASSGREVAKLGGPRLALQTKYYRARAQAVLVAPGNARRAEAIICVWRTREGFDACAKAALEAPVKLAVSLGGPAAADSAVQDWSCEVDAEVIDADLDTWSLERDESPALSVRRVGRHASRMPYRRRFMQGAGK